MREEGRIDRSSHRWRDVVAAGLPDSSVLRFALSELEGGGRRGEEEEGRRRSGAVPCVHAAPCGSYCRGVWEWDRRRTVHGRVYLSMFFGHDMSFGWAPGPLGKPWLAGLGIFGLLHLARLTREQLTSWLGSL
jgi:hypothetical protein